MSDPVFAHIHDGSIAATGVSIRVSEGTMTKRYTIIDKTSVGDGVAARFDAARHYYYLSLVGWLFVESAFPKAMKGTGENPPEPASGAVVDRVSRASIIRRVRLVDATAAPDLNGTAYFEAGQKVFYGSAQGFLQSTEKPFETFGADALLATLSLYVGATALAGKAIIDNIQTGGSFRGGGPVSAAFNFRYSEVPTSTPAILGHDSMEVDVRLDNGRKATGTIKPERIQVDLNFQGGANIPVRITGPFHGAVTFESVA